MHYGEGGSLEPRTAIAGSFSAWGGLGKLDRRLGRGETFFPDSDSDRDSDETFKFHENSVSNTSSSFVSSIHSLVFRHGNKNTLFLVMLYSSLFNYVFKALSLF
jgi:hypothetical protein